MQFIQNRRHFLAGAASAGAAGLIGTRHRPRRRRHRRRPLSGSGAGSDGAYCWGSLYLAGELMRADGLTDVQYVQGDPKRRQLANGSPRGETDFDFNMPSMHIRPIEAGVPIKILTGVHSGCFELIANDSVQQHCGPER